MCVGGSNKEMVHSFLFLCISLLPLFLVFFSLVVTRSLLSLLLVSLILLASSLSWKIRKSFSFFFCHNDM